MPRGKHNNHVRGSKHPRWNPSAMRDKQGYRLLRVGIHPWADPNGYIREHVLVVCSAIGRQLAEGEVIHHSNGDLLDNRLENLELMSRAEHNHIHLPERDPETGRFVAKEWRDIPGLEGEDAPTG
jgi:hypothetical protein